MSTSIGLDALNHGGLEEHASGVSVCLLDKDQMKKYTLRYASIIDSERKDRKGGPKPQAHEIPGGLPSLGKQQ
jgi:hypothetical protein